MFIGGHHSSHGNPDPYAHHEAHHEHSGHHGADTYGQPHHGGHLPGHPGHHGYPASADHYGHPNQFGVHPGETAVCYSRETYQGHPDPSRPQCISHLDYPHPGHPHHGHHPDHPHGSPH